MVETWKNKQKLAVAHKLFSYSIHESTILSWIIALKLVYIIFPFNTKVLPFNKHKWGLAFLMFVSFNNWLHGANALQ